MAARPLWERLTERQQRVLRLVMTGKSYKECAKEFGTSIQYIKNCMYQIFNKLGCDTRLEAAVWITEELVNAEVSELRRMSELPAHLNPPATDHLKDGNHTQSV